MKEASVPVETVTAEWIRGREFLLRDHQGFPILMANPGGVLGADLLPLSLIGCAIWDVTEILRKQRQRVERLKVEARSEREDEQPWRFRRIRVVYRIWGTMVDRAAVERAVRLTEDRYCSIMATLRPAVEILSEVELIPGSPGAADAR